MAIEEDSQREKWVHYYVSLRCYDTVGTNYNNKYNCSVIFEQIYKVNNEIPDYFCQLSDFYIRTAYFIHLIFQQYSYTIYHNKFTTLNYKLRKFMEFLRVECRCTNFRQEWANKDKKLVFLSLSFTYLCPPFAPHFGGVLVPLAPLNFGR